jgi:cytochrome c oxidase subunit 2
MRPSLRSVLAALVIAVAASAGPALAAVPEPWQLGLQEAVTPVKAQLDSFHDLLLIIITAITLFVLALLVFVVVRFRASANPTPSRTSHNTVIEVVWTVVPVIILVIIAIPSFRLLYFMEKAEDPQLTVKAIGHQWYWEYEYPDHAGVTFSSYMIPDEEIRPGMHRLLEVDNRVVVPVNTTVRLLTTAGDVLHAFAVPAFGVKKDAIPGRTNETWFRAEREGVYYGQCSEICGTGHGFMPIAVEVVSRQAYDAWLARATAGDVTSPGMLALMRGDAPQTAQLSQ